MRASARARNCPSRSSEGVVYTVIMLRSLTLVAILWAAAQAPMSPAQDAPAEAAIRAIVAEQAAAWNAGDGTAYAKDLAPDASFTNLFGMVMYGKPAFTQRHREILATFYKGTTKRHNIRRASISTASVM